MIVETTCEICKWKNSCGKFKSLVEAKNIGENVIFNCEYFEGDEE